MKVKPKTWKKIPEEKWNEIREFLTSQGGIQDTEVRGVKEVWRIRIEGAVFTLYENGTLFCTGSSREKIGEIYQDVSKVVGRHIEEPVKDFLIGLDETGKGEVLGHSILVGSFFPKSLVDKIDGILGSADTKKKKSVSYWNGLFLEIDRLRKFGVSFIVEKIPPWHVDKYNLNKIMDVVYQRILSQLTREIDVEDCRIILDDYGVGRNLSKYLGFLSKQGAETKVESKADEKYLEAKLASIIAKREREMVMKAINVRFSLPNCPVGSGNAGDPLTLTWIKEWKKTGKEWPWFVKQSFVTIREIDGKKGKMKKEIPPIRH